MTHPLERWLKTTGDGPSATIGLEDWNGVLEAVGNLLVQLIQKGADFDAVSTVAINVLLDRINGVLGPAYDQVTARGQQVEELYAKIAGSGVSADVVLETADRFFLTTVRRAAILSDVRGGVDAAGDTLAKLYALARLLRTDVDANTAGLAGVSGQVAAALAQLASGFASLDTVTALAVQVAQQQFGTVTLPDGFVEDYDNTSFIDPASTGYFLDTSAGQVVGGVGAQTFVLENASSLPKMTSNTQTATGDAGYLAFASNIGDNTGQYDPYHAFDKLNGAAGTYWATTSNAGFPQFIGLKVPVALRLAAYAITQYSANANYVPTAWRFEGTNDPVAATNPAGASWTILDAQTGQSPGGNSRIVYPIAAGNQASYLYHRLVVTAGVNPSCVIGELEFLQYTPCFETYPSLPAMTSATLPAGYIVTASSQTISPAWNALSQRPLAGNPSVEVQTWDTDGGATGTWIQLQTPNSIKLGGYSVGMYNDNSNYCYVDDFQLLGSNTGNAGDWNILDTRFGVSNSFLVTSGYQRVVLNIPPAVQASYKYHRLIINKVRTNLSATRVILTVWDLLQVITGVENQTSILAMTGQNAPAGQQALSTALQDATLPAWKAWDNKRAFSVAAGNGGGSWEGNIWHGNQSAPGWVTRSLPAAITVLAYRLAGLGWGYPNGVWQLQGTNDDTALSNPANANWTILDSRNVGQYSWLPNIGDVHTFKVQNPGSYKHYRMYFPVGGQDGYCRVNECELLQGTTGNMDLRSRPYTRNAGAPSKASITLDLKVNAGVLSLNTNLRALVSRNAGGQFTPVTLSLVGPVGRGLTRYQSPPTDLSGQPVDNRLVSQILMDGGLGANLDAQICLGAA